MIDLATLAVFSGAVVLLLSPGLNMAFVISHGVTHGLPAKAACQL